MKRLIVNLVLLALAFPTYSSGKEEHTPKLSKGAIIEENLKIENPTSITTYKMYGSLKDIDKSKADKLRLQGKVYVRPCDDKNLRGYNWVNIQWLGVQKKDSPDKVVGFKEPLVSSFFFKDGTDIKNVPLPTFGDGKDLARAISDLEQDKIDYEDLKRPRKYKTVYGEDNKNWVVSKKRTRVINLAKGSDGVKTLSEQEKKSEQTSPNDLSNNTAANSSGSNYPSTSTGQFSSNGSNSHNLPGFQASGSGQNSTGKTKKPKGKVPTIQDDSVPPNNNSPSNADNNPATTGNPNSPTSQGDSPSAVGNDPASVGNNPGNGSIPIAKSPTSIPVSSPNSNDAKSPTDSNKGSPSDNGSSSNTENSPPNNDKPQPSDGQSNGPSSTGKNPSNVGSNPSNGNGPQSSTRPNNGSSSTSDSSSNNEPNSSNQNGSSTTGNDNSSDNENNTPDITVELTEDGCNPEHDALQEKVFVTARAKKIQNNVVIDEGVCERTLDSYPIKKDYLCQNCVDELNQPESLAYARYLEYWLDKNGNRHDLNVKVDRESPFRFFEDTKGCPFDTESEEGFAIKTSRLGYLNKFGIFKTVEECRVIPGASKYAVRATDAGCDLIHDFNSNVSHRQKRLVFTKNNREYEARGCHVVEDLAHEFVTERCRARTDIVNGTAIPTALRGVRIDNVFRLITQECEPQAEVAINSTYEGCISAFNFHPENRLVYLHKRYYYELSNGRKKFVTSCVLSEDNVPAVPEWSGEYEHDDTAHHSKKKTGLWMSHPFNNQKILVDFSAVRDDSEILQHVQQDNGHWLRPDGTLYAE